MKLRGRDALGFARRPDPDMSCILVYGPDPGQVTETADQVLAAWKKAADPPFELERLHEAGLRSGADDLMDRMYETSLFGGSTAFHATLHGEAASKTLGDLLKALDKRTDKPAIKLLIRADALATRSKLRKVFEGAKYAMALQLFERSPREFDAWLDSALKDAGVNLTQEARQHASRILSDPEVNAVGEIEKLALYSGGRTTPVTLPEFLALATETSEAEQYEIVDLAMDGALDRVAKALSDASPGTIKAIPVLFALTRALYRFAAAHTLAGEGKSGSEIGNSLFPRVFPNNWAAFERSMRRWSPTRITAALSKIAELEQRAKEAGMPDEALVRRFLMDIAR